MLNFNNSIKLSFDLRKNLYKYLAFTDQMNLKFKEDRDILFHSI